MAFKYYYYDSQIKKYILQFMAIFAGMQAQIGKNDRSSEEEMISVPIMYGNRDRVVGWIKGEFTQNKPIRLPMMSAVITGIALAPEMRKGVGAVRRNTYLPRGEVIPDGIKTVRQQMPIPYKLNASLAIWASNHEQRYQILEQILMVFDPILQIQKNDALFDWTKITTVELTGIDYEDNYPIGTDRRMLISNLTFELPIWISAPANIKDDFVKDIYARIGVVGNDSLTNEEMVADLDAQGIQYELWFDGDALELPDF